MILQTFKDKVDRMSLRERILVTCVGISLFVFPGYMLVMDRLDRDALKLKENVANNNNELTKVSAELDSWRNKITDNPNDKLREEKEKYKSELKKADKILSVSTVNLIDAAEMPTILSDVLNSGSGITIESLQSIPPIVLFENGPVVLYRHGIKISLKGKYIDIMRHLKTLEGLQTKFFWKSMDYKVTDYPYAEVVLELYTLSINKDFIRG